MNQHGGMTMETKGLLSLQIMMFLLMGVGVVLRKKNIITKECAHRSGD